MRVIREGYWDEHLREVGGECIYKFNWFVRYTLRLIHGKENQLP